MTQLTPLKSFRGGRAPPLEVVGGGVRPPPLAGIDNHLFIYIYIYIFFKKTNIYIFTRFFIIIIVINEHMSAFIGCDVVD
jgi:hypothetical protein